MEEIAKLISVYGVTIVIVALFIWDWIDNKRSNKETLIQLKNINENMATSLELLKTSIENQGKLLLEHDRRSIEIIAELKRGDEK